MRRIALAVLFAAQACAGAALAETRCGWVVNPTPGNWWLTDSKGEWIMMTQGVDRDPGMDRIPDTAGRNWVETNSGGHGYGCGCMGGAYDAKTKMVTKIASFAWKPLSACRKDKGLKAPE
ncbi:hypothetical protein CCR94_14580 [Rhodoblastus sphagnicola]|uniref:DUF4087 domain-containing protein n=1 Tax=Rhodoblastus sphagnicola TaxID=333368 RepID=A0A2S6N5G2_9HYPH|nr:DUF4087 domain-containing protein [Rhodoblastus sphagnicola]MBB4197254.1 hypothetical protein [Rhodoblastus sphagnicola]PPQ29860.1 hypothetical protein CCR94_14580 [Rhodoblastus sphagnicola]